MDVLLFLAIYFSFNLGVLWMGWIRDGELPEKDVTIMAITLGLPFAGIVTIDEMLRKRRTHNE